MIYTAPCVRFWIWADRLEKTTPPPPPPPPPDLGGGGNMVPDLRGGKYDKKQRALHVKKGIFNQNMDPLFGTVLSHCMGCACGQFRITLMARVIIRYRNLKTQPQWYRECL
jgi:hypothetical protein